MLHKVNFADMISSGAWLCCADAQGSSLRATSGRVEIDSSSLQMKNSQGSQCTALMMVRVWLLFAPVRDSLESALT